MKKIAFAAFLGLLCHSRIIASDHIDGPITTKHAVADITDLYAFPTPNTSDSLILILDVYPFVPSTGHFSERVSYNFLIRRANIARSGPRPVFQTSDEIQISCEFETPHDSAKHSVTCTTTSGLKARSIVSDIVSEGDFRLFAGLKSDPFFFNARWAVSASNRGKLLPPQKSNSMASLNVLTIVIDVQMSKLFPGSHHSLFAIAASTTTRDDANAPVRQLDRIGRPEITNVALVANNATDLRDRYNKEQPFNLSRNNVDLYRTRLKDNVTFYDRLNGKAEWQKGDKDALVQLLLDDFLVIDLGKPCSADNFFEIERAMLEAREHASCGGRKLTDDIMDTLFTYCISRGLEPVRDGIDRPDKDLSATFPYLASPSTGLLAKAKAALARWYFGD